MSSALDEMKALANESDAIERLRGKFEELEGQHKHFRKLSAEVMSQQEKELIDIKTRIRVLEGKSVSINANSSSETGEFQKWQENNAINNGGSPQVNQGQVGGEANNE